MLFLVFLGILGICSCQEYNYHAEQNNVTFTLTPNNKYINLISTMEGPTEIEYLTQISSETGLMVRMVFGKDDGVVFDTQDMNDAMNICDVLAKEIDDPHSPQAQFNLAESLGLFTSRCPIEKGIKVLDTYEFPEEFFINDLGCGARYYEMIVESSNDSLGSGVIMKMHVDLDLTKLNETCTESSTSTLIVPSVITTLAVAWIASKFNN